MGSAQSTASGAASPTGAAAATAAASPPSAASCPVLEPSEQQSRCPVPQSARARAVYNVYGQRIDLPQGDGAPDPLAPLRASDMLDPKNNMPLAPNQQPCPGQRKLLSTNRIESNIPKGGTQETWVYPSPQMFFNGAASAARRRGPAARHALTAAAAPAAAAPHATQQQGEA